MDSIKKQHQKQAYVKPELKSEPIFEVTAAGCVLKASEGGACADTPSLS